MKEEVLKEFIELFDSCKYELQDFLGWEEYQRLRALLNQPQQKECECSDPILQDQTKQCGRCKKYIDRVEHVVLTNQDQPQQKEDEK